MRAAPAITASSGFASATSRAWNTAGTTGSRDGGHSTAIMPRLRRFRHTHPFVELRLLTHNNLVDLAARRADADDPGRRGSV